MKNKLFLVLVLVLIQVIACSSLEPNEKKRKLGEIQETGETSSDSEIDIIIPVSNNSSNHQASSTQEPVLSDISIFDHIIDDSDIFGDLKIKFNTNSEMIQNNETEISGTSSSSARVGATLNSNSNGCTTPPIVIRSGAAGNFNIIDYFSNLDQQQNGNNSASSSAQYPYINSNQTSPYGNTFSDISSVDSRYSLRRAPRLSGLNLGIDADEFPTSISGPSALTRILSGVSQFSATDIGSEVNENAEVADDNEDAEYVEDAVE